MKPKLTIKTIADLSSEVVEGATVRPENANPQMAQAGELQPRRTASNSRTPEYCGLRGYEHWGLNE
jgi:hypothetical protein